MPVQEVKKSQPRATSTWWLRPSLHEDRGRIFSEPLDALADRIAEDDIGPPEMYEPRGPDWDRGPMPVVPLIPENVFILKWAALPLVVQWAFLKYTGYKIPGLSLKLDKMGLRGAAALAAQLFLYQTAFILFATQVLQRAQRHMQKYGTLNEENRGRDLVPDAHHRRVSFSLLLFTFVRAFGVFALARSTRRESPSISWKSPFKMGLYLIALDYFFYVYHRTTHEVDFFWKIHAQHHATKAPTPQMSLWADDIQDLIEWAIVPSLAFATVKLNFSELWITCLYVLHVEAMGHSGIRAYFSHPLLTPVLKPFNVELAVEDHDLHHRYGRGGKNYGKQTRIWDTIFGTVAPREEEARYNAKHAKRVS